jgi:hypothetical protein
MKIFDSKAVAHRMSVGLFIRARKLSDWNNQNVSLLCRQFVKSFKARLDNICVYWSVDWVDNKLSDPQAIYEIYFDCY